MAFLRHAARMDDTLDGRNDALLKLALAGGAGANRRALLDAHGGDATATLAVALRTGSPVDAQQRAKLRAPDPALLRKARDWLQQPDHHLIGWNSADYPPLLRGIANPPFALFVEGEPTLLWLPSIAVVGSRHPTSGGRDNARDFAHALASDGMVVASGLAAGIDAAAHAATLAHDGGHTIAVLGTGPDLAYPRGNADLRERIAQHGAVVSEFPPGTPPRTEHFPSRNRILAGLSLGTLVIEAAQRSGALITARLAAESGREVFAVPGSIRNPLARGCHKLIREGAQLVESADEVLAALAPMANELAAALRLRLAGSPVRPHVEVTTFGSSRSTGGSTLADIPPPGCPSDDPDYQRLWQALGHDPSDMDALVQRSGLTAAELSSMLLLMELDGRVTVEHGRYQRKT